MTARVLLMKDLPFEGAQLDALVAAAGPSVVRVASDDVASIAAALQTAEIAVLAGDLDDRHLAAPNLRWVHCDHAGLNASARPEVFEQGLIVTGSAGRSSAALAEHAMMFALLLSSDFASLYAAQQRQEWLRTPSMRNLRALSGRTMGIVGMGYTGLELAKRAKAFGMRVLGYRRQAGATPEAVDEVFSRDAGQDVEAMLPYCDVLVLAVSLTNETKKMIGTDQLALLPPGALVMNMARGEVIDQDALIAALETGQVGGAGLDVTTPEPLPQGHRLWSVPGVLITPHFTPALPDKAARSLDIILENFRRYRTGEPMLNRLTPNDLYQV